MTTIEILYEAFLNPYVLLILFISVLIGFSCAIGFFHLLDSRVFDENGKQLPGPSHHLWGKNYLSVLLQALRTKQFSKVISEDFLVEIGDGNLVATNWITGVPSIVVAHPDMTKTILSGHHLKFTKEDRWKSMRDILGLGMVTHDEKHWTHARNSFTPIFRSSALRGLVSVFNIHSRRLLRHWHFRLNKAELEFSSSFIKSKLDEEIHNLMLGIIFEAAFSFDFYTRAKSKAVSDDFQTISEEISSRMTEPTSWWNNFFPMRRQKVSKAVKNMKDLIEESVKVRIEQFYHDPNSPHHVYEIQENDKQIENDLLQLILCANEDAVTKFSVPEMRDHILTFMLMGYESTASTLIWLIYELCKNPEVQRKCRAEVQSILTVKGVKTSAVVFDDIGKFSILIQVLKETLRLHPPSPLIHRKSTVDCDIGEFHLKAGANVTVSVLALHRHPDYWYLPNEFFPDRFAQENIAETIKHPFQYLPFGAGPHNCIGQRFAQMTIIVIMVVLLSKFTFSLDPEDEAEIKFEENTVFSPKNIKIKITSHDRKN